jgi:AAA domain
MTFNAEQRARERMQEQQEAKPNGAADEDFPPLVLLGDCQLDKDVFWTIEDVLPRCNMLMIFARGGSGKTYLGTSVALGIGAGQWFTHTAEQGAVLICAFERPEDTEDRLAALRDRLGYANAPVALLKLGGDTMTERVTDWILKRAKELEVTTGLPVRAIEIDTVSAALAGAKEDDEGLGRLRSYGEKIHAATGALVIWIHHEGKGDSMGPRGHLALADGCTVWWHVEERESNDRVVHVAKANRGPAHVPLFAFKLVPFEAGRDRRDKAIELCELQQTDLDGALASPVRKRFGVVPDDHRAGKLGSRQKLMLHLLNRLAGRHPAGVDIASLRSAFILDANAEREREGKKAFTADQARTAFSQTLGSLRDRELVEGSDDALLPAE